MRIIIMKNFSIQVLFLFVISIQQVFATDYYVSENGAGDRNGSSPEHAARFNDLSAYLRGYSVSSSDLNTLELNVYIESGTYTIPDRGYSFNTASNIRQLNVVFQPYGTDSVIFKGVTSGSYPTKFITLTGGTNADDALKVTIDNIHFRSFHSDVNSQTGNGSLFSLNGYNQLYLKNSTIDGVSSRRNPLVSLAGDALFDIVDSKISNILLKYTQYALVETVTGSNQSVLIQNSELTNWRTENITGTYNCMFLLENNSSVLSIDHSIIQNCRTGSALIGSSNANNMITLKNSVIKDNIVNTGSILFNSNNAFNELNIHNCTVENNQGNSIKSMVNALNGGTKIVINGSTFANNRSIDNIIACGSANLVVYNNTFSGNGNTSYDIVYAGTAKGVIINNTFYNSNDIDIRNSRDFVFQNNLLLSSGTIPDIRYYAGASDIKHNIIGNVFYESGTSNGTTISNIGNYVNMTLTEYEPGRPKVHSLIATSDENPILKKGGDPSGTAYKDLLVYDQRGKKRPKLVSIGSCDLSELQLKTIRHTILYDPTEGLDASYLINMGKAILSNPEFVNPNDLILEIITQPYNGQLNATSQSLQLSFDPKRNPVDPSAPAAGIVGVPFEVNYRMSYTKEGRKYSVHGVLQIIIVNIRLPMGIIDEQKIRCFTDMQKVEFDTRYKYISGSYLEREIENYGKNFPNTQYNKFYGFSIPLVGDLDGDGKPEIVALGIADESVGLRCVATYLYILNGQTGKVIVKYSLPVTWNLWGNYWHNSPSQLVLVDSDRNGKAEIIVATGYNSGNQDLSKRLISYEVNENTFADREGGTNADDPNKLDVKWNLNKDGTSDLRYDAYGQNNQSVTNGALFSKPLPQVVDIDGDGKAEVVVYNKIYDAQTGRFIMKFEDLSGTRGTSSAYVGQDQSCDYGDYDIGFSYIYDVDRDGVYDIAAGGKLYYQISLVKKTYQIRTFSEIKDGHTAVADINADGIPEIIVSVLTNTSANSYQLLVWDPGLLKKNMQGDIIPDDRTPEKMVDLRVPCDPSGHNGHHSYIYVGDVDGKEQNGKKFPEISVLGPHFFLGGGLNARDVPVHPNVKDGALQNDFRYSSDSEGGIYSFTWDDNATDPADRLKISFLLEHQDNSINTGFTLFDFDNDGVQDICYRDEQTLRIISASKSLVRTDETDIGIIRFNQKVRSYTGYEYPVVADIDGGGSAKMLVMGYQHNSNHVFSYVYAVESSTGKFAPAPKVWNQFMYSPLKINEDLMTPLHRLNPLDTSLRFHPRADNGVWTFPYNNTITQVVKSAIFSDINSSGDTVSVLRPVVYTADAQILHAKINRQDKKLQVYVKNNGDATLNAFIPVCLYREDDIPNGFIKSYTLGTDLFVDDSLFVEYDLTDTELGYDFITLRVSDATTGSDTQDKFMTVYSDCNWADNIAEIGDFVLRDVNATVAEYKSVIIDVLANDTIPQGCEARLQAANITTPAGDGILSGDFGTVEIIGNKLEYTAPATYSDGVVKITYKITCGQITRSADVYIYILESCYGHFSVCKDEPYQVCLESHIENVKYEWYNEDEEFMSNIPPYFSTLTENSILYVKPKMPVGHPYQMIDFPVGQILIDVLPTGQSLYTARWVGTVDMDWNNPRNWVRVANDVEYPISWIPTHCVDVVLSEKAAFYPMLDSTAACANIELENRAMIAGLHHLTYDQAQVNTFLTMTDLDRFIMWSSPLKSMYTGDYHFGGDGPNADRGDVYMNFFQSKNPDYPSSVATENVFTATFARLDTVLSLGQAFGMKIYRRDGLKPNFSFPKMADHYKYEDGRLTGTLVRTDNGRFIVDGAYDSGGGINLPVNGDNDFRMIHVANPFMAYLDIGKFLAANDAVLEQSYKLWNGDINENFVSIILPDTKDQRFIIDFDQLSSIPLSRFISPLQSFFVIKKPGINSVKSLYISDSMTTTIGNNQGEYVLRNAEAETHILRIKAAQDKYTDMTVIYNNMEAKPEYSGDEDSRKLFNENSKISVYTFSLSKIPLAINATGDFSVTIPIGVKVKNSGMVTFDFTCLSDFGYDVVLTDRELKKSVDLEATPFYSFMVEKGGNEVQEMNDRFTLRFTADVGNEEVGNNMIRIMPKDGFIEIHSSQDELKGYQVYNLLGQLVIMDREPGYSYRVEVPSPNFYVVRVNLSNGEFKTEKVFVD